MNDKLTKTYRVPDSVIAAHDKMDDLHNDWRNAPANERGPLYGMYDDARGEYIRALNSELQAIRASLTTHERELFDRTRSIINTIGALT